MPKVVKYDGKVITANKNLISEALDDNDAFVEAEGIRLSLKAVEKDDEVISCNFVVERVQNGQYILFQSENENSAIETFLSCIGD